MKIKKILNNNAVIAVNDKNEEVVAMGKGLAFQARNGQDLQPDKIDKLFVLGTKEKDSHFEQLISEIDLSELEFAVEMVNFARMELGKNLGSGIYLALIDHINTCKERAELGAYVQNSLTWDIKRLYKDEFKTGQQIVARMNVRFGAQFDDNEAAVIATHLINAEKDLDMDTVYNVTRLVNSVLNIVKYEFSLVYDEDALSYYRFVTHLQFFAERLFSNKTFQDDSGELYDLVRSRYSDIFVCTAKVVSFVKRRYGYDMSSEEQAYLTVHIAKVVRESRKAAAA